MRDVTEKYINMIEAFECDFALAKNYDDYTRVTNLAYLIGNKDENILKDIELLEELSFNLRHNKVKIVEYDNPELLEVEDE